MGGQLYGAPVVTALLLFFFFCLPLAEQQIEREKADKL